MESLGETVWRKKAGKPLHKKKHTLRLRSVKEYRLPQASVSA